MPPPLDLSDQDVERLATSLRAAIAHGWGEVSIIVENHQAVRIKVGLSEWLSRSDPKRKPPRSSAVNDAPAP